MKKIYATLLTLSMFTVIACSNNTDKEKNGLDSIAATPNPTSTDTLRMTRDTSHLDTMPKVHHKKMKH